MLDLIIYSLNFTSLKCNAFVGNRWTSAYANVKSRPGEVVTVQTWTSAQALRQHCQVANPNLTDCISDLGHFFYIDQLCMHASGKRSVLDHGAPNSDDAAIGITYESCFRTLSIEISILFSRSRAFSLHSA